MLNFDGTCGPCLYVYRIYLLQLSYAPNPPNLAARTPFTCLLDAAKEVWVLRYRVSHRGHSKPANVSTARIVWQELHFGREVP